MQHEPIGYDNYSCEQTELSDRPKVDTKPDNAEQPQIREGGQSDGRADFAEAETYSDGNGISEGHRENRLGLRRGQHPLENRIADLPVSTCSLLQPLR